MGTTEELLNNLCCYNCSHEWYASGKTVLTTIQCPICNSKNWGRVYSLNCISCNHNQRIKGLEKVKNSICPKCGHDKWK